MLPLYLTLDRQVACLLLASAPSPVKYVTITKECSETFVLVSSYRNPGIEQYSVNVSYQRYRST